MRKPNGVGQQDRFYYKVQSDLVKGCVLGKADPVITDWMETEFFVTSDRVAFYIIPKDKMCLSEKFYYPCDKLYGVPNKYLRELYIDKLDEVLPTGNQYKGSLSEITKIEFKGRSGRLFCVKDSALELFPKQRIYCQSKSDGPLFVCSSLKVLLGGVWPIKPSKTV